MESHVQNPTNVCACVERARNHERSMTFGTHACRNHYKSFLEDFYKQMTIIRAFPKDFTNQSLLHELQDSYPDVQEYLSNMLLVCFS